jgi:hypothetical protein
VISKWPTSQNTSASRFKSSCCRKRKWSDTTSELCMGTDATGGMSAQCSSGRGSVPGGGQQFCLLYRTRLSLGPAQWVLATQLRVVLRSRLVDLYLHSPIHLHGMAVNYAQVQLYLLYSCNARWEFCAVPPVFFRAFIRSPVQSCVTWLRHGTWRDDTQDCITCTSPLCCM